MATETVNLSRDHQGVATLRLDRPDKRNAFDATMIADLTAACEKVAADPSLRVMVLAANGQHFCAGADLDWMQRMVDYDYEDNLRDARALAWLLELLNGMPQITIARVQGAAFGGAVGLLSCCDMAVATPDARFSLSEVKLGLIPATISPYVIAAIGARAARRYFTTAEVFDAATAHRLGLLSEIADVTALDDVISTLANTILGNGPMAVVAAKQLVAEVANQPVNAELIEQTCEHMAQIRVSAQGQEGMQAFVQKRSPNWNRS
jgi:methylglutaconyl-CoA hydratase